MTRQNLEREWLSSFDEIVREMAMSEETVFRGTPAANRFDCGFDLKGNCRFQFGDLRLELPDRTVVVEIESGGGITNLVKFWPLAMHHGPPILLLHVFAQASVSDYLAHLRLWDFTWSRMREDLLQRGSTRLSAARFVFEKSRQETLRPALSAFRTVAQQPLEHCAAHVFGDVHPPPRMAVRATGELHGAV